MDQEDPKKYDINVITKKLQIIYMYSQKTSKSFRELLENSSLWDEDCKYALSHKDTFDIKKLL